MMRISPPKTICLLKGEHFETDVDKQVCTYLPLKKSGSPGYPNHDWVGHMW